MQLLLIDLGDGVLVKREKGDLPQGLLVNGRRYYFWCPGVIIATFADVRAAIDALEADEEPHLLSCPFCSGEAYVTESTGDHYYWRIHCSGCDVATIGVIAKELAYSQWNRRGGEIPTVMPKKRGVWTKILDRAYGASCEIWRYTCGE